MANIVHYGKTIENLESFSLIFLQIFFQYEIHSSSSMADP